MAKKCPACNADNKDAALVCEYCGTRLSTDKPRSAGSNGEKRFCTSCGKPLAPDAAFCPFCGAKRNGAAPAPDPAPEQVPAARPTPPRTPSTQGGPAYMQPGYQQQVRAAREAERQAAQNASKTKKSTRGLSVFLSLLLAVQFCVAAFRYPGFLRRKDGGVSSSFLTVSPDGLNYGKAETQTLRAEKPVAEFQNGVKVDFGEEGLLVDEQLSVREAKPVTIGDSTVTAYDFKLGDNDSIDLPMLVTASLPIERGMTEANVSVRCWDDELETWVPVYSEIDEDGEHILFYPEHFSSYATFARAGKEKDLSAYLDKPLFYYIDKNPTPTSTVYLDEYALAARIRDESKTPEEIANASWLGKVDPEKQKQQIAAAAISAFAGPNGAAVPVEIGSSLNSAGTASDVGSGALVLLGQGESSFANGLGTFGTAITVAQFFASLYRNKGDILETTRQNWDVLLKMATEYSLKRAGLSNGWVAVLYVCYLGYKELTTDIKLAYHLGAKDDVEFAYHLFTMNYVVANGKTGKVSVVYEPNSVYTTDAKLFLGSFNLSASYYEADQFRLLPAPKGVIEKVTKDFALNRVGCELEWSAYLKNLAKSTDNGDPAKMIQQIDRTIDSYCRAFWNLSAQDKKTFLSRTNASYGTDQKLSEVWKEPTEEQKKVMINQMKAAIYATNKNVIRDLIKKSYYISVNNAYLEAVRLERYLNEKLTFELVDGSGKNFENEAYRDAEISLRQFEFKGDDDFVFSKKNNYTVTCTRYAWKITSRGGIYPKYVDVKAHREADSGNYPFTFADPKTVITIDLGELESAFDVFTLKKDALAAETYLTPNDVFEKMLAEQKPYGNTVTVKPNGEVEIMLVPLSLTGTVDGYDYTAEREGVTLKGTITDKWDKTKQKGAFDAFPELSATQKKSGSDGGGGSGGGDGQPVITFVSEDASEMRKLADINLSGCGFTLNYDDAGRLVSVEIYAEGMIESSMDYGWGYTDPGRMNTYGTLIELAQETP